MQLTSRVDKPQKLYVVRQKSWHFLVKLDHHTAWFSMIGYWSCGQNNEIKCFHIGTLKHLEKWVLISSCFFFKPVFFRFFWRCKSEIPFWICTKLKTILPWFIRGNFSALEKSKKLWRHLMLSQKPVFRRKSQKFILCTTSQTISWPRLIESSENWAKRCLEHVVKWLRDLKFLKLLCSPTQGVK